MRGSGLQLSEGKPRGVGATIRGLDPGGVPGAGLLRYGNQRKTHGISYSAQLPRLADARGSTKGKIYTGADLFKYRQSVRMYSMADNQDQPDAESARRQGFADRIASLMPGGNHQQDSEFHEETRRLREKDKAAWSKARNWPISSVGCGTERQSWPLAGKPDIISTEFGRDHSPQSAVIPHVARRCLLVVAL